jgi:hypothetical protein
MREKPNFEMLEKLNFDLAAIPGGAPMTVACNLWMSYL